MRTPAWSLAASAASLSLGSAWSSPLNVQSTQSQRAPAQARATTERILRVYQPQDIVTLDWQKSSYEVDSAPLVNLQEGLLGISSSGRAIPAIAERWTVAEQGRVYKFHLRKNVKWSDGVPLVAQHFIDAWKRLLSRSTAAPYAYLFFDVMRAEEYYNGKIDDFSRVGIFSPDPYTIEIELRRPMPNWYAFLSHRSTYPIREDLIRQHGNLWTKPGNLVTTGPFVLLSHELGRGLSLRRNPHYYGRKKGNIDQIDILIRDPSTIVELVRSNQVDLVFKVPSYLKSALVGKNELQWFPPIRTKRLSFNLDQYPLTNPAIREAIARVLDRKKLAQLLGSGYLEGATLVPPGFLGFDKSAGVKVNESAARALYRKAVGSGTPPSLTLLVPSFDENAAENIQVAKHIQATIQRALTMKVELEIAQDSAHWGILSRGKQFAMILHDWKADFPDSDNFYAVYSSRSKHTIQWKNVEYDQAVFAARTESDARKRQGLYRKADELLTQRHFVMIPLYYASEGILISKRIQGLKFDPFNYYRLSDIIYR